MTSTRLAEISKILENLAEPGKSAGLELLKFTLDLRAKFHGATEAATLGEREACARLAKSHGAHATSKAIRDRSEPNS